MLSEGHSDSPIGQSKEAFKATIDVKVSNELEEVLAYITLEEDTVALEEESVNEAVIWKPET